MNNLNKWDIGNNEDIVQTSPSSDSGDEHTETRELHKPKILLNDNTMKYEDEETE